MLYPPTYRTRFRFALVLELVLLALLAVGVGAGAPFFVVLSLTGCAFGVPIGAAAAEWRLRREDAQGRARARAYLAAWEARCAPLARTWDADDAAASAGAEELPDPLREAFDALERELAADRRAALERRLASWRAYCRREGLVELEAEPPARLYVFGSSVVHDYAREPREVFPPMPATWNPSQES